MCHGVRSSGVAASHLPADLTVLVGCSSVTALRAFAENSSVSLVLEDSLFIGIAWVASRAVHSGDGPNTLALNRPMCMISPTVPLDRRAEGGM